MLRRERVFKDRFSETTEWLRSRYRFPKTNLMDLCRDLQPLWERETKRTKAIPAHIQRLSTLGFLATGTFQRENSRDSACVISQPTFIHAGSVGCDNFSGINLHPVPVRTSPTSPNKTRISRHRRTPSVTTFRSYFLGFV